MTDVQELLKREEAAWAEFVAEVGRVPEHRRGDDGVVPGWSVNDLVFHNGKWAGVAAEKLVRIRDSGSAGEEDPDEVWQGKNALWAAESKSMLYQEAMSRALADREAAREALTALPEVTDEAASWFKEETFDHYQEHTEEVSRFADGLEGRRSGVVAHEPEMRAPAGRVLVRDRPEASALVVRRRSPAFPSRGTPARRHDRRTSGRGWMSAGAQAGSSVLRGRPRGDRGTRRARRGKLSAIHSHISS